MKLSKWYSYSFKSCIMCYTMPISIRIKLFKTLMLKMVRERMVCGKTIPEADDGSDALNVSLHVRSKVVII